MPTNRPKKAELQQNYNVMYLRSYNPNDLLGSFYVYFGVILEDFTDAWRALENLTLVFGFTLRTTDCTCETCETDG